MRLRRLCCALLVIESIVGALCISGPAGALESPSGSAQVPDVPALPVPQQPTPEVPAAAVPSPIVEPATLPEVAPLRSEPPEIDARPASVVARSASLSPPGRSLESSSPASRPSASAGGMDAAPGAAERDSVGASGTPRAATSRRALLQIRRDLRRHQATAERRLQQTVEGLSGCLSSLPRLESTVLTLRAGLGPADPLSPGQVARRLGVPTQRAQAAERRGLRGLRQANRATGCGSSAPSQAGAFSFGPAQGQSGALSSNGLSAAAAPVAAARQPAKPAGSHSRGVGRVGAKNQPKRSSQLGAASRDAVTAVTGSSIDRWVLVLLGLVGVGALVALVVHRRRSKRSGRAHARGHRGRAVDLTCAYCQSPRIAVNPAHSIYQCAQCGFRGTLSPEMVAGPGQMREHVPSRGADGR